MVKVNPTVDVDEVELNRKLRHACPRIKRWKTRIDDADGDVHRLREQAINKSPVYVAIQRGSRNIQIRTRTKPKWWRKWIQEGKRYGLDDSFVTPIHIPSEAYRYQKQVSFSKRSPQSSPRRSLPVSPVKTGIHSPIKVSVLKNEQYIRSPKKESVQKGVPMLTLTPVPLNQVLKKKARMIGQVSTSFGKGRWIDQDSSLLAVPGTQVYQYDSSSETEDEREKRGGELLNKLITPLSPTDALKRLASAKRRETPPSPKSPKRSPTKGQKDLSEEESESDSHLSPSSRRIRSKIRAAGQTSLLFSPSSKQRKIEDLIEESEEERPKDRLRSARDRSATIRKMRATGTITAALSPRKSPSKSTKSHESSPKTPTSLQKKMRAIGKTSAALSSRPDGQDLVDEEGNVISAETDVTHEKSPSTLGSIFRKIKTLTRLSSPSKAPDASHSGISSLMTKMRFLMKLSPRKKRTDTEDEEEDEEEEETEGSDKEVKKRKKTEKSIKSAKEEEDIGDEEEEELYKKSCFRKCFNCFCPCIARRKEPQLMEYESGSQQMNTY